jgi:hypothetical protein
MEFAVCYTVVSGQALLFWVAAAISTGCSHKYWQGKGLFVRLPKKISLTKQ